MVSSRSFVSVCATLLACVVLLCITSSSWADSKAEGKQTIVDAKNLPPTLSVGKTVHASKSIKADVFKLKGAVDAAADAPICSITCKLEVGAIQCPVGQACECGCPGDYAKCECVQQ